MAILGPFFLARFWFGWTVQTNRPEAVQMIVLEGGLMEAMRWERMSRGINPLGDTSAAANQREFSHFRINASGVVLDYQSSLDRRPARSPADVIGRHVSDVLPEEFATPILCGVAECLDAQSVVDVDYTLQLENGDPIPPGSARAKWCRRGDRHRLRQHQVPRR